MGARDLSALVREHLGREVRASEPLAPGLGLRRFVRLHLDGPPGCVIARLEADEDPAGRPPGVLPEPPLEPLRTVLETAGLPVPGSHGHLPELGVDLLEDVGDESLFTLASRDPARLHALLPAACELIPRLQRIADPGGLEAFQRRLDRPLLAYKGELFARHSLPLALGRPARPDEAAAVAEAFGWIADRVAAAPVRLAHRDFQSQNLFVHGAASGDPLVMIDLQGAFLAPPEYDLVCLLRDSYLRPDPDRVASLMERTRRSLPDAPPAEDFAVRFDLLTLARKAKDHARFVDVALRRGQAHWLAHLPVTARVLREAAERIRRLDERFATLSELVSALPRDAAEVRQRLGSRHPEAGGGPCAR